MNLHLSQDLGGRSIQHFRLEFKITQANFQMDPPVRFSILKIENMISISQRAEINSSIFLFRILCRKTKNKEIQFWLQKRVKIENEYHFKIFGR